MLATMDPNRPIFAKDYVKPRGRSDGSAGEDTDMVENSDGYFDGLPVAKHHRGAPLKLTNQVTTDQSKLRRMMLQFETINNRIWKQKQKVYGAASVHRKAFDGPIPVPSVADDGGIVFEELAAQ